MKSFITFFREAYLPPTGTTGVESLPVGVPIYIGDGKPVKRPKKSLDSLDINTNSKSNISSTPATQKLNTSDQNAKDTPDLNLNQDKIGKYATRYYMK
jgi:hypothetical protein